MNFSDENPGQQLFRLKGWHLLYVANKNSLFC